MVIAFLCDKIFSHVIPIVNIVSMLHMKRERKYSPKYYIHSLDYIKGMNSLPVIFNRQYPSMRYNISFENIFSRIKLHFCRCALAHEIYI